MHKFFIFFTMRLLLFNKCECIYGMRYEYIHTYIQTDTVCVQHVNVGLAQACPNYLKLDCAPNSLFHFYGQPWKKK